jgi:hypothetical protein
VQSFETNPSLGLERLGHQDPLPGRYQIATHELASVLLGGLPKRPLAKIVQMIAWTRAIAIGRSGSGEPAPAGEGHVRNDPAARPHFHTMLRKVH